MSRSAVDGFRVQELLFLYKKYACVHVKASKFERRGEKAVEYRPTACLSVLLFYDEYPPFFSIAAEASWRWLHLLQLKNMTKNRSFSKMMDSRRCDRLVSHRSNKLRYQLLCLFLTQRLVQRHSRRWFCCWFTAYWVCLKSRLMSSIERKVGHTLRKQLSVS